MIPAINGLSIDIGGTKTAYGIVCNSNSIKKKWVVMNSSNNMQELVNGVCDEILKVIGIQKLDFVAIDIPGSVGENNIVTSAPNISGSKNFDLVREVEKKTGFRPFIIDDRASAVIAEAEFLKSRNLISLIIGTGVGAGIVLEGTVLNLVRPVAGSVGWNLYGDFSGKTSKAIKLEDEISGKSIERIFNGAQEIAAKTKMTTTEKNAKADLGAVFKQFDSGTELLSGFLSKIVNRVSIEIVNLVNTLMPDYVILNGKVGLGVSKRFANRIQLFVKSNCNPIASENVRVEMSALGENAFLIGLWLYATQPKFRKYRNR